MSNMHCIFRETEQEQAYVTFVADLRERPGQAVNLEKVLHFDIILFSGKPQIFL